MSIYKKYMGRDLSLLVYAGLSLVGFWFSLLVPLLWHSKFLIDGAKILSTEPKLGLSTTSFEATSFLLSPINDALTYIGVDIRLYGQQVNVDMLAVTVTYVCLFHLAMLWVVLRERLIVGWIGAFVLVVVLIFYAPFYSAVSKEIVVLCASSLVLYFALKGQGKVALLGWVLFCSLYALAVRVYFAIFLLVFIVNYVLLARKRWFLYSLAIGLGCLGAIYLLQFEWVKVLLATGRAEGISDYTASYIHYPFSEEDSAGVLLNRSWAFIVMSIPLHLLWQSVPQFFAYAPFVVFQLLVAWVIVRAVVFGKDDCTRLAVSAVVAFMIAQAWFEPDFGSAFRHKIMMLPFIYYLFARWYRGDFRATVLQRDASAGISRTG